MSEGSSGADGSEIEVVFPRSKLIRELRNLRRLWTGSTNSKQSSEPEITLRWTRFQVLLPWGRNEGKNIGSNDLSGESQLVDAVVAHLRKWVGPSGWVRLKQDGAYLDEDRVIRFVDPSRPETDRT